MGIFSEIRGDFRSVFDKDPAATSALEVVLTYSGFHAIAAHRVIHRLARMKVPFVPRLLSQVMRFITGIEIHPGARIDKGLFIDHGMGVVIGETTQIGEGCLLYQGVTLGGTGKEKGKRHPTLGRGVVVGAGAKVLGAITVGDYAKIGANSVVLKSVPRHAIVVGIPGTVIKKKVIRMGEEGPVEVLDHVYMPNPVEERFIELEAHIGRLEKKLLGKDGDESVMRIHNTMTGRKEVLETLEPGHVGMYVCGITVYDDCHLGHARSAIVFDMMRQYFRYRGLDVKFVKNFTDIDDKIINRASETGMPWDELAEKYTARYHEDMALLWVEPADVEPKATEHMPEIIEAIEGLMDKGFAYEVEGDVYFEIARFKEYGKLSGRKIEDMQAGARVDVDERKRGPMDFALWKSSKEGEPSWPSPWGPGRPGWHIECTAMSMKHLGETFDIHGGGADLVFPHHENELTQSEAYTGKPFVRYWVHNGFINVDREKMSKSLGNFFTIKDILKKFDPEVVRAFLLQTHYRSPIEFSDELLRETETSIDRYYQTLRRAQLFIASEGKKDKAPEIEALVAMADGLTGQFGEAMDDDFNSARATGHLFELIREVNRFLDRKPTGQPARDAVASAIDALGKVSGVLRIFNRTPEQWYSAVMKVKDLGINEDGIKEQITAREAARKGKDWEKADEIRTELLARGIVLEDTPAGTLWRVKVGA